MFEKSGDTRKETKTLIREVLTQSEWSQQNVWTQQKCLERWCMSVKFPLHLAKKEINFAWCPFIGVSRTKELDVTGLKSE